MEDRPHVMPPMKSEEEVVRLLRRYPVPTDDNGLPFVFDYGTAGFRYDASLLESVMVRVGILAAYRSGQTGQAVGIMVTASHNDESYNGVKLADPHGGMMASDGEALAVKLANASSDQEILELLVPLSLDYSHGPPNKMVVHVGRDTRHHSPALTQLAIRAAQAMGATVLSHGVVTTPILHHAVMHANPQHLPLLIPPRPNVNGYYDLLAHSYYALLQTKSSTNQLQSLSTTKNDQLVVDCACGVGYAHVQRLQDTLQRLSPDNCRVLIARNAPGEGPLNEGCGSEHVQKEICPPKWYSNDNEDYVSAPRYAASVDGDADRIVFFSQVPKFTLLDGDKIAVLLCTFLQAQVKLLADALYQHGTVLPELKLGVVQTAYANGASTAYLEQILGKDRVLIAKTGVKHVHHAAHTYLDIGVYFEANGHGTILFSEKFYQAMATSHLVVKGHVALRRLCLLPSLVNQAVGDALSDLLLVDAILQLYEWDIQDWSSLYTDFPSRQCKVKVEDRSMIQTNDHETRCIRPAELQVALDAAMQDFNGRCFVRPSGTENVVRVYAEASTGQEADALATKAAQLVHDYCCGAGEPPSFPTSKM